MGVVELRDVSLINAKRVTAANSSILPPLCAPGQPAGRRQVWQLCGFWFHKLSTRRAAELTNEEGRQIQQEQLPLI